MKKLILFTGLLLSSFGLFAQKISNIDFDAIKKSLDNSPGLYKQLLDRFLKSDTTLTPDDYQTLYYGQCYQQDYNPYGSDSKGFDDFKKHYVAEEYSKALPHALKMIEKKPMDMPMTFRTMVCYHKINDEEGKEKMKTRYNNIMKAFFESGDGKSAGTAFVTMSVSDEYELMAGLGVQNASQSLIGNCDVMTLKKNDLGLDKMYFNISKPFESMSKMFKEN